ncbi:MAG: MgtC/SapB family protein, partial [Treponema sp.]|nr:MgtC/SapB family protein [Treponema sp.]
MITDPIATLLGSWSSNLNGYSIFFRIVLSVLLSSLIGWERSSKRHSAGFRTFMVVTLSGTVVMLVDLYINSTFGGQFFILSAMSIVSAARIATRTLYFSSRNQIMGLTTSV